MSEIKFLRTCLNYSISFSPNSRVFVNLIVFYKILIKIVKLESSLTLRL